MLHHAYRRLAAAIAVVAALSALVGDRPAAGQASPHAASTANPPGKPALPQPARICMKLVGRQQVGDAPGYSLAVTVSNPNEQQPLSFIGYRSESFDPPIPKGQISPIYKIHVKRAGQWREHPIGRCGTGMGAIALAPQSTATFGVWVPDDDWQSVRVDVTWTTVPFEKASGKPGDFTTVWSNELTHKEVQQAK